MNVILRTLHDDDDDDQHLSTYKWVVFSPGFALLGQSAESDTRHCCSSTPPCGKTAQNKLIIQFTMYSSVMWFRLLQLKTARHVGKLRVVLSLIGCICL